MRAQRKLRNKNSINAGILPIELNCDNGAGRCGAAFIMLQSGGIPKLDVSALTGPRNNTASTATTTTTNIKSSSEHKPSSKRDFIRTYSDGGGKSESSDASLAHTAAREMREESANLIAISPEALEGTLIIDIAFRYKCFIVIIDTTIDNELFTGNRALIRKQGGPPEWLESANVTKFYVTDLLTRSRLDTAFDINGTELPLSSRAQLILNKMVQMQHDSEKNIHVIPLTRTVSTDNDFTLGTTSYASNAFNASSLSDATTLTLQEISDTSQNSI